MRAIVICILSAVSLVATAAETTPVSGTWQIHIRISERESDVTCSFVQKAGQLTGTCTSPLGSNSVTGKVDGEKVTWTYKTSTEANGTVTLTYRGALNSATAISGSVEVQEFGVDGDFTATLTR